VTRRRQIDAVEEIGNATVTHVSPVHVPKPLDGGVERFSEELW
jgi:hypothetical protein